MEEVVEERTTPSASALPLLFLQVFHQPAFDHMLELTVQAPEVMASRLLATLQQILHTIMLAQSPAPQRRENRLSSGHTALRPEPCNVSQMQRVGVRLKGSPIPAVSRPK